MENQQLSDSKLFAQITKEMAELYAKKNANYGNSFSKLYKDFGIIGGVIFLRTKVDRITSLIKGNKNNFESLEDSLRDLANYAVMTLVELQKERGDNK